MKKYRTAIHYLPIQYEKEEYKQDWRTYCPQLVNLEEVKAFLGQKANEMCSALQEKYPEICSVEYKIDCFRGDWEKQLFVTIDHALTDDERHGIEAIVTNFQKKISKEFNNASFSATEYGSVKFGTQKCLLLEVL